MQDVLTIFRSLRRPPLLIRAARIGMAGYDRSVHLARHIGHGPLPRGGDALMQLIDIEAGLETAREPITCNAICPGYVMTPLVEDQIPDTAREYEISEEEAIEKVILAKQPSKEFVTVEQLAGMALFLCSDAAAQITGTTISVDGGWTAL